MPEKSGIALVTGAGAGIGAAIAKRIASRVEAIVLLDLNREAVNMLAKDIHEQTTITVIAHYCDVGNSDLVEQVLSRVKQQVGTPDILINNAGIGGPFHQIDEVSDEEWEMIFNTNVKSIFNFAKRLLPEMKKKNYGRIVNIASVQGYLGAALSSTYVASKHAVIGYTRAIAAEWGNFGITCNAICPGYVDTQMGIQNNAVNEHLKKVVAKTPAGRIAMPDEIASLVDYLISDDASFINGASLTIDGGLTCHVGVS